MKLEPVIWIALSVLIDILKDTLVIPKSVKKSPGFAKLRSQNSKMRFSVVDDVIYKYYVIVSVLEKGFYLFLEYYDNNILISMNLSSCRLSFITLVGF